MDKFFANLGGGGDKKSKASNDGKQQKGRDPPSSSWQGGTGDMSGIKKKNVSVPRIGGGTGGGSNKSTSSENRKGNNVFEKAGAGINDALGKIDLFNKSNKTANNRGGGQSLGGSKPGRVFSVSLDKPGSLGMEVERRKNSQATAIISGIVPKSQAEKAGLKRGDIVCHHQSNGEEEIRYDQFLAVARSGRRPLKFDVRRIESSVLSGGTVGNSAVGGKVSADSYARKQAVIAAAEARDAKHKAKQKPIPKTEKRMDYLQPKQQQTYEHIQTEDSEETRRAVAAVKKAEEEDVMKMGYNPYESKAMTSGQARTATVAMTSGEIKAENAPSQIARNEGEMSSPGRVTKPNEPTSKTAEPPTPEFEHAFSTVVTSNPNQVAVLKSLSIMRKLVNNAITKGQQGNDETSAKFRRVRLSNPKIKEVITDMLGALELMMSVGFILSENDEDGETYLVFPPGEKGYGWLGNALGMMESYENGGS